MTRAGYITDRRCPSNPEHGPVLGMRSGGYHCPHIDHTSKIITKYFWREDEFEAAKSEPPTIDTSIPVAIPANKVRQSSDRKKRTKQPTRSTSHRST